MEKIRSNRKKAKEKSRTKYIWEVKNCRLLYFRFPEEKDWYVFISI